MGVKILLNEIMISLSKSGFFERGGLFKLVQTTHKSIGIVNIVKFWCLYRRRKYKGRNFYFNEYNFFIKK